MSKFMVALDVGTREQRNTITDLFQKKGWNVWHWMEDVWLLAEVPDEITSQAISEEIGSHSLFQKNAKFVVIGITDSEKTTYWGRGSKEGWAWMTQFWGNAG
jgi:hypothetical protein